MAFLSESIEGRASQQMLKRRVGEIENGEYVERESEAREEWIEKGYIPADSDFEAEAELLKDFAGGDDPDIVYYEVEKAKHTQASRQEAAKKGHALSDGSYPIDDKEDLDSAITLAQSGHGNVAAAKSLIKRRAKDLDATDKLPEGWR